MPLISGLNTLTREFLSLLKKRQKKRIWMKAKGFQWTANEILTSVMPICFMSLVAAAAAS